MKKILLALCLFSLAQHRTAWAEDIDRECDHFRIGEKCKTKIHNLHPTQGAVGKEEVRRKTEELKHKGGDDQKDFRREKRIPVVVGPSKKLYMIDHHHAALTLLDLGYDSAYIEVVGDLSNAKSIDEFWAEMRKKNWCYPFDGHGHEIKPTDIPSDVRKLDDDPDRSLAGIVRDWDGYAKEGKPFEEFVWARRFEKLELLRGSRPEDYDQAAYQALALIKWGFWNHPDQCADHLKRFLKELDSKN